QGSGMNLNRCPKLLDQITLCRERGAQRPQRSQARKKSEKCRDLERDGSKGLNLQQRQVHP
ncbi:hypothetical protein ACQJ0O_24255, partial [Pseudomonas shirazensis]|uniref:hypothetical protein n=1 Tax=Pseudomonas shirazensis TaxID=2745494 RepID=UPI003D01490C